MRRLALLVVSFFTVSFVSGAMAGENPTSPPGPPASSFAERCGARLTKAIDRASREIDSYRTLVQGIRTFGLTSHLRGLWQNYQIDKLTRIFELDAYYKNLGREAQRKLRDSLNYITQYPGSIYSLRGKFLVETLIARPTEFNQFKKLFNVTYVADYELYRGRSDEQKAADAALQTVKIDQARTVLDRVVPGWETDLDIKVYLNSGALSFYGSKDVALPTNFEAKAVLVFRDDLVIGSVSTTTDGKLSYVKFDL